MNPTHSFLTDGRGKRSHTRLLVMVCVPCLILIPLLVWAGVSIHLKTLAEIPLTITGYIGAANGILLTYAGVKGYHEKDQKAPPSP